MVAFLRVSFAKCDFTKKMVSIYISTRKADSRLLTFYDTLTLYVIMVSSFWFETINLI